MSNEQLYLALGIPGLMVLIGVLINVGYFVAMNGRMAGMENRMTALENRMTALENRFQAMENRFDTKFDLLIGKIYELDSRMGRIEEQLKR